MKRTSTARETRVAEPKRASVRAKRLKRGRKTGDSAVTAEDLRLGRSRRRRQSVDDVSVTEAGAGDVLDAMERFADYATTVASGMSLLADSLERIRRDAARSLSDTETSLRRFGRGLKHLSAAYMKVVAAGRKEEFSLGAIPLAPALELGADDQGRLTLDGQLLEVAPDNGRRRFLSKTNLGGRLLLEMVNGGDLAAWKPRELANALQFVKRAIGGGRVLGRGRKARLAFRCRVGAALG